MLRLILGLIYTMAFPLIANAASAGRRHGGTPLDMILPKGWIRTAVYVVLALILWGIIFYFRAKQKKQRNSDEECIQHEENPSSSDEEDI